MAAGVARSEPSAADRINFSWLLKLRWVAVTGQVLTTIAAQWLLGLKLPIDPLFTVIGIAFVSNVLLTLHERRGHKVRPWMLGSVMALDVLLLTALLFFAGGPFNPFTALYFVHVAHAAIFLDARWAWTLVGLSLGSYGFLFLVPAPSESSAEVALQLEALTEGRWVAFGLAAGVIAYFVTRVQSSLATRETELAEERIQRARSEKLASLATLSAGAAHELSTPLSTIAVVAKELERALQKESARAALIEDTHLIREQVARCRSILEQMAADAGHSLGELSTTVTVQTLLELCLDGLERKEDVTLQLSADVGQKELHVPPKVLAQALRGIVKNALDASPPGSAVELLVKPLAGAVSIEIRDQGGGMPPDVLRRVGEPFFTTKEPGRGMGLGVFLARAVAERVGGELRLDSVPERGTTATVLVPIEVHKT